ncbi:15-hydroxyprostaglandin dehydrogenase [NAD(+)]-like [Helicoverpa zea]|uniref:15-hydroxyprostaglandin dehydrogenase [NAD(+)]-like n=1 Tax=Helicoverpa zea TaxID=7113 RepID=UPI001F56207F|nr:15-hydroxyprostaglandin dehydrogenase [NAD(+)]-like [Helicoverpa zea]
MKSLPICLTLIVDKIQWDPKGRTFLITCGASGLGAGYALAFLNHGAKRVAILDIAVEVGATAERLNKSHPDKAVFISCDVSKEEDIAAAFAAALAQLKQIDIIINNAGIMVDAPNMWRTACDVNWQGVVSFSLKGINHMRKDEGGAGGTIVNIASIAAISRAGALPIYYGSKIAVLHFSQCISEKPFYGNTGVRVLTMCLGGTDTPLMQNLGARSYDRKLGEFIAAKVENDGVTFQKVESGVKAMVDMFNSGTPGSIWLSIDNKPVQDISPKVNSAFEGFEKLLFAP